MIDLHIEYHFIDSCSVMHVSLAFTTIENVQKISDVLQKGIQLSSRSASSSLGQGVFLGSMTWCQFKAYTDFRTSYTLLSFDIFH